MESNASASGEDMTKELEAVRMISEVLTNLQDPASCMRVLRRVSERCGELAAKSATSAARSVARVSDPMLTVGELTDLFPSSEPPKDDSIGDIVTKVTQSAAPLAAVHTGTLQLGSLVHNFVSEFQRLTDEWQTAFAPTAPEARATF